MPKNQFSPLEELPDENDLKNIVNNLEYKRIASHEVPQPLANNGLVSKCNSFLLGASGSTSGMLYSLVGIRPDKNDIDEHPFVMYYDYVDSNNNFGGIIHHGDWPDRTTSLSDEQVNAMVASGLTASFTYKSVPDESFGSLYDLKENGMLEGLSTQFDILFKNKP